MSENGRQHSAIPRDLILPPREETEGRGQGSGRWLEDETYSAFKRWGYSGEQSKRVYGCEVDVVMGRSRRQNRPSDWVVVECKDWEEKSIPPQVLFRLCTMAFTCQAVPVLVTTTGLTREAAEIARNWEIRVLSYADLQRGSLPGPQVIDFRDHRYDQVETRHFQSARHRRGRLPEAFQDHPFCDLCYVPGYKPVGRYAEYKPTTISRIPQRKRDD